MHAWTYVCLSAQNTICPCPCPCPRLVNIRATQWLFTVFPQIYCCIEKTEIQLEELKSGFQVFPRVFSTFMTWLDKFFFFLNILFTQILYFRNIMFFFWKFIMFTQLNLLFSRLIFFLSFFKIFEEFSKSFFESKWNNFFWNKRKCTECTGGDCSLDFVEWHGRRTWQFDIRQVILIWLAVFCFFYYFDTHIHAFLLFLL